MSGTAAILHINEALELVAPGQLAIEPSNNPELGYPMWGGKDAGGVISRWPSLGKAASFSTLRLTGPTTAGAGAGLLHHNSFGDIVGGPLSPTDIASIGVEPYLGLPPHTGYVLSSTVTGVRSWIPSDAGAVVQPLNQVVTGTGTGITSHDSLTFDGSNLTHTISTTRNSLSLLGMTVYVDGGSGFNMVANLGGPPNSGILSLYSQVAGGMSNAIYGLPTGAPFAFACSNSFGAYDFYSINDNGNDGRVFFVGANGKIASDANFTRTASAAFADSGHSMLIDGSGLGGWIYGGQSANGGDPLIFSGFGGDVTGPSPALKIKSRVSAYKNATIFDMFEFSLGGTGGSTGTWINMPTGGEYRINGVAHVHSFASLTSKPTTISGYGITDLLTQVLTGYVVDGNTALAATDTILGAFQKVQGQINARTSLGTFSATLPIHYDNTTGVFTHDSADGNKHVIATGTTNNNKALVAGSSAGSMSWTTIDKAFVGLGSVENTALSTWAGTSNITTLGTVATGTWHGTAIADSYISSATVWNSKLSTVTSDSTSRAANTFYAAPNGSAGVATFRSIAYADLGTGGGGSSKFLREDMTWQTVSGGSNSLSTLSGGALSLIPVGSSGSAHTTFDGSVGPILSYDVTNGLRVGGNSPESLHLYYGAYSAGTQSGVCFELQSLESGSIVHKSCYAEAYGEIVGNVWNAENGAYVIKTNRAGTMTEAMRIDNLGHVGIGVTPTDAFDFLVNNNGISIIDFKNSSSGSAAETRLVADSDVGNIQIVSYSSTRLGYIVPTVTRASNQLLSGTGSVVVNATTDLILATASVERMRLTSAGNILLPTTANFRLGGVSGSTARYPIDVYNTSAGIHIASLDGDYGAFIGSDNTAPTNSIYFAGGAVYNGSSWIAKSTGYELMWARNGQITFYAAPSGQTVGSALSTYPIQIDLYGQCIGVGTAAVANASIQTLPGTSGISPLNIGAFSAAYTMAIDGAIWKDAADTLKIMMGSNARSVVFLEKAQTFTAAQTFPNAGVIVAGTGSYAYTITGGALATAGRSLTLPAVTTNDTFAVLGLAQTFSASPTFSAQAKFTLTTDVTAGTMTSGSAYCSGGFSVAKGLQAAQLSQQTQTSATTTGAITWTLTSGAAMYLSAALTGAVTMNITVPLIGTTSQLYFIQGASAQTVTLSMASVVFRQTNGTGTGTGTYAVTGISTVSAYYCIELFWATATLCYVTVR